MTVHTKYSSIVFLSIVAFILSACGAGQGESVIATKVAMTVEAQNAQATTAAAATITDLPPLPTEVIAPLGTSSAATNPPPTAPSTSASGQLCTASASFVSETIPDGTIESAGSVFTKTWRIKNTGTCPWNTSWKWVYVSGDLMGGATFYNFPSTAAPGDTVDVPVVFTAPADGGSYRGYWKIQSPWGMLFGDSDSGSAFWVDIVVGSGTPANNKTQTVYGVTNVTYDVSRTCTTANTFYTITAYLSSNGPVSATYTWVQSDGNNKANNKITFLSAMTKSATRDWSQSISSSQNPRWIQVIVTSPSYQEFPKFDLPPLCNAP